jgi:tRNA A-37 threonylcarbamoyl transferase component Bud32
VIGERVGSYRVVERLGEGGMGLVYAGVHETIGKRAAIKILRSEYSRDAEVMRRFFNEARATSQIRHLGLVDVYDFGQLPNGCAYIVMELLEGESLHARLRRQPRPPEPLALAIASQLAAALGAAHLRGVIHRDLKPDNIFLLDDAALPCGLRVKVLDFGVAKLSDAAGARTRAGTIVGTPKYMAPEQCRGEAGLDHRADIYSLGCIMYELAAGRPPFIGSGAGEVIAAQLFQEPPPLATLAPAVTPGFARVVRRCLAKKAAERYDTMVELGVALGELAGAGRAAPPTTTEMELLPEALELGPGERTRRDTTLSRGVSVVGNVRPTVTRLRQASLAALVLLGLAAGGVTWLVARHAGVGMAAPAAPSPGAEASAATSAAALPAVLATAPAGTMVAPAAKAVVPTVRLELESFPPAAEVISADGERVGETPWASDRPRGTERVVYFLRKKGYRLHQLSLDPSVDQTVRVRLVPELRATAAAPIGPAKASAAPAKGSTAPAAPAAPAEPDAAEPESPAAKVNELKNPFIE